MEYHPSRSSSRSKPMAGKIVKHASLPPSTMSQRFKAGDPLNPYDPVAFVSPVQDGSEVPQTEGWTVLDLAIMVRFMEMMNADIEDAERRGETLQERILREKREWIAANAKAAKLKDKANEVFRKGDYEEAFVMYSACADITPDEPVYKLNRAAALIARRDLEKARAILPADPVLIREAEFLSSLEAKSFEELLAWVVEQDAKRPDDLFGQDGLTELVQEKVNEIGANLDHQFAHY
ncbi:hypothetical protein D9758_013308 [Tetrapyrgos nigripes]|uniref:Uncharacterized protein n=1 Tax=Tetrapyrgos nigripes TaxID=182062 RepID=A0A8H5FJM7_9AGAR|nr:hypothetical protein D9758_013308 [Tetrapyrgos nigripes]